MSFVIKTPSKNHIIALFIPSLRGGGAERVFVTLANEFAKRGYEVDLLLVEKTGPYLKLVSPCVRIIDFGKGRVFASLMPLIRYLRQNKPTALISAMNHTNIISLWAGALSGSQSKFVVSVRNAMEHNNTLMSRAKVYFFSLLMRVFYPRAHSITTVSEGLSEYLRKLLPSQSKKIITIYNPIFTPELKNLMNEPVKHPLFNKSNTDKPPVILAVGRLNIQKDYKTLINAFHIVRKKINAQLVILGEGEERTPLEKLIKSLGLKNSVDLFGFVSNPFPFMKQADLFVLSSKWEGLPGALVQAMACGSPVVATDCPFGPAEILENGKWGRLVPIGDADALAIAMIDTIGKKDHPSVVKRAKDFSLNGAVNKYLYILDCKKATIVTDN